MKHNLFLIVLLLSVFLVSCLKNETKEQQDAIVTQEEKVDTLLEEKNEFTGDSIIFTATISTKKGLMLQDQPGKEGKEIGIIPYQATVEIIEHTNQFESSVENDKTSYGQWLRIRYSSSSSEATTSGYILDSGLNYNHGIKKEVPQDTVLVKNEIEFLEALASNRIVLIDTDTLNLERYYDQLIINKKTSSKTKEERYEYTPDGNLELIGYTNFTLQSIGKPVQFIIENKLNNVLTITDCSDFIIDGFNFYHKVKAGNCEGKVCVINQSNNGLFINSEFNGSGAIGAYIENSSDITFNKSRFYNNSRSALTIDNSSNLLIENSVIYENDSYILVDINQESAINLEDKKSTESIQLSHTFFVKNNTSAILRLDTQNLSDNPSEINFFNCSFMDNTLESFISFQKPKSYNNILFSYCEIIDNESADEDFNFIYKQGIADTITFEHSTIKNNQNENTFQVDFSKTRLKNTFIDGETHNNMPEEILDSIH